MRIGIVGAGRIGGNAGQLFARAGHEVFFSGSREPDRLEQLAFDTFARSGSPGAAVEFGEVVLFSVPWPAVDELLAQTGSLAGKMVIDTTNQFVTGEPEAACSSFRRPSPRPTRSACPARGWSGHSTRWPPTLWPTPPPGAPPCS